MNTDKSALVEAELTERIIGVFYAVYNELGSGFIECVYTNALAVALREVRAVREAPIAVYFRGQTVGEFRADFIVEGRLILEIKAVDHLVPVHESQLINYLKSSGIALGLLLNFGPRAEFRRRIYNQTASNPRSSVYSVVKPCPSR